MERKTLSECALFDGLSPKEVSLLLGCAGARYRRMLAGTSMHTDRIIVVLSGELVERDRRCRAGAVLVAGGGPRYVATITQSEAFLINCGRLLFGCCNACGFHKTAIANLMRICRAKGSVDIRRARGQR
jgi:hypothetical protein